MISKLTTILQDNILSYWTEKMEDRERGGFYGRMSGEELLDKEAPKGAVLHARILWSFSAAYRVTGKVEYRETADRAFRYFVDTFIDPLYGGVFWSVTADGQPLETKKQFYALGFALYALSEYYRATQVEEAKQEAIALFRTIEERSFDAYQNGYFEAKERDWSELSDVRLSDKDTNALKTMNTHLHILEPYTNLYRIWPDSLLKERIENLITLFLCTIQQPDGHLGLFFDEKWQMIGGGCSYGHDIEASWLILEAAEAVNMPDSSIEGIKAATRLMAEAAMEGFGEDGGMSYEKTAEGTMVTDRHWWVQAEAVVGQYFLWRNHAIPSFESSMKQSFHYICNQIIDREAGEWFWSCSQDGIPNRRDDKAGFWKCPYHNSRMCLELMEREGYQRSLLKI